MEMKKNNTSIPVCEAAKNVAEKRKSLTPAILGMPNSHGVKFSVNMTSEDKKDLLAKLEEWRKARKQKLAASILAKQKQADKFKASISSLPIKSKPISSGDCGSSKFQDRQSVFERLYQNSGKIKKQEVILNSDKQQQISESDFKKSALLPLDKIKKHGKVVLSEKDETKTLHIISKSEDNSNKGVKLTKPVHFITDQIKVTEAKSFKNPAALKSIPLKAIQSNKGKTSLRRSISMMFHQKCRVENSVRRSVSAKNLLEMNMNAPTAVDRNFQTSQQHDCDTKIETVSKSVMFATPKNTKLSTSTYLRTKLEDWLQVKGHSLEGYRHLRCFGVSDIGKPLTETAAFALDDSHYATAPNTPGVDLDKENVTPPTVVQQAGLKDVENWLEELHRLIVELKYPPDRCEEWLTAIRKKCTGCSQLPIYWECLAALHESKGDLKSAIEDYERAIIKGGEVDTVGESLAQLFDKMVIEQKKCSTPKLEKGLDPKNIFKSTIIKFALQQKAIKKLTSEMEPGVRQQLYIATPVRRSTRLQTPFKATDEYNSLQVLTPEFRKNVTFKPNESLLSGD